MSVLTFEFEINSIKFILQDNNLAGDIYYDISNLLSRMEIAAIHYDNNSDESKRIIRKISAAIEYSMNLDIDIRNLLSERKDIILGRENDNIITEIDGNYIVLNNYFCNFANEMSIKFNEFGIHIYNKRCSLCYSYCNHTYKLQSFNLDEYDMLELFIRIASNYHNIVSVLRDKYILKDRTLTTKSAKKLE